MSIRLETYKFNSIEAYLQLRKICLNLKFLTDGAGAEVPGSTGVTAGAVF